MDYETIALMVSLFGLNYILMWTMYRRVDSFSTVLKMLCREHQQNHGGKEIGCE